MYNDNIHVCDPIWENHTKLMAHFHFEQMLTFKHSQYGHLEANEIWYPGRPVNAPPTCRYHI